MMDSAGGAKQTLGMRPRQKDDVLIRAREIRTKNSPSMIPLDQRDALEWLSLAVLYDESHEDEELLQVPLEKGCLLNREGNNSEFQQAIEFLHEMTKAKRLSNRASPEFKNSHIPITPIILTGLIVRAQEKDSLWEGSSSEIYMTCRALRNAAIRRIRLKKRHRLLQRVLFPVVCIVVLLSFYLKSMSKLKKNLVQLRYMDSCERMEDANDVIACEVAEAVLWAKYKDYGLTLESQHEPNFFYDHNLLDDYDYEAPFALHRHLFLDTVPLNRVLKHNEELISKSSKRKKRETRQSPNYKKSLQWLGGTTVNRLVKEALDEFLPFSSSERTVLDAGCGVGGTLYALLSNDYKLNYHGITSSAAEAFLAERIFTFHNPSAVNYVTFEQRSFHEPLPAKAFDAVVAIESVAISHKLPEVLRNFVRSLKQGGVLVVVEDIDVYLKKNLFRGVGCEITKTQDLNWEYQTVRDSYDLPREKFSLVSYLAPWDNWLSDDKATKRLLQLEHYRSALSSKEFNQMDARVSYQMIVCSKR